MAAVPARQGPGSIPARNARAPGPAPAPLAGSSRGAAPSTSGQPAAPRPGFRTASPHHKQTPARVPVPLNAAPAAAVPATTPPVPVVARVLAVCSGESSALGPDWATVFRHIADRIGWADARIRVSVLTLDDLAERAGEAARRAEEADVLLCVGVDGASVSSPGAATLLRACDGTGAPSALGAALSRIPTRACIASSPAVGRAVDRLGGYSGAEGPLSGRERGLASLPAPLGNPWRARVLGEETLAAVRALAARENSDDLMFLTLVLVDAFVAPVPLLPKKGMGPGGILRMLRYCTKEVVACLTDPTCKRALEELEKVGLNDQVGSYRVIVSFETQLFQEFALCVVQKHNCMDQVAEVPTTPDPAPLATYRGRPMTHELAEEILMGSLADSGGDLPWSWKVTAGQNAAYDQFPCQFQLYYRGRARNSLWYDPTFKVTTLDGEQVWCRRHYRVRRGEAPGVFWYSVLDNGVISTEHWKVLDADDEGTFLVCYYQGAAKAAGLSYTGSVICTKDGVWPTDPEKLARIERALGRAGIKMWELCFVDHTQSAEGAPIDVREGV